MTRIIVFHGLPGVGKLTTARHLHKLLPTYRLFHNHLVVDACLALFEWGTSEFLQAREHIWLYMFRTAIQSNIDIIFTFSFEETANDFFGKFIALCNELHAEVLFVRLFCERSTVISRLSEPSRTAGKLTDGKLFESLLERGSLFEGVIPTDNWLEIDNTDLSALETSIKVRDRLLQHIETTQAQATGAAMPLYHRLIDEHLMQAGCTKAAILAMDGEVVAASASFDV
jgi:hypothetical protein